MAMLIRLLRSTARRGGCCDSKFRNYGAAGDHVPPQTLSSWHPTLGTEAEAIQSSPRFFPVSIDNYAIGVLSCGGGSDSYFRRFGGDRYAAPEIDSAEAARGTLCLEVALFRPRYGANHRADWLSVNAGGAAPRFGASILAADSGVLLVGSRRTRVDRLPRIANEAAKNRR